LIALPIIYGIQDLTSGYPGFAHGHATTSHDLTLLGNNLVQGISNGTIWALIAIGYTLVYGIIELINFAHGDVFMIGSFTGAGFWASIGLGLATGPVGLVLGLLLTLIVSMLVCGSLRLRAPCPPRTVGQDHHLEAGSLAPRAPALARLNDALAPVRRAFGRWGLLVALLALPVVYAIHDLTTGYGGYAHGHATVSHDLTYLGNNLVQGISNGTIWALIAIGYTLVYGIIELINFAHGDVFMIGSFTAAGFWGTLGLGLATGPLGLVVGLIATLIVSMLVCGSLNVLIERVAYRPLRGAPKLAPLITAVGFSFILQNVGLLWLGGSPQGVNDLVHQSQTVFTISGVPIQRGYLLALLVMIPLVLGLAWFITNTRPGRAMRATAQDPEAARLMGIDVNRTISLTFLLGGMLAGAAGLVYALYETNIWYFQGFEAGLIAFTAAVMGGIGNVRGAVLGGLIIGVIQSLSDSRMGPQWTEAVVFGYLIVIMILRPRGLLGEETREAG
ncbi:MAG: branched-chain amino acid ABC transporter permease, partial [Solirubrobacterales bacterium]|nr:branched-chain amino acid ABC transporter permease [Solirubrobacterales bacterium]